MNLVVDVGNTRLKWALARGVELVECGSTAHGEHAGPLLGPASSAGRVIERALIANVAGASVETRLVDEIQSRLGLTPELVAPSAAAYGVRSAYRDPTRLGVDRWVAMIAAHARAAGGICVISVGTAATFDAVDDAGRHLGGLILPGVALMADALDRGTGRIGATRPAEAPRDGIGILGRSTDEAVGHAALLAIAAAFDRAVRVAAAAMAVPPTVFLTGGDAERVRPWLESSVQVRADLVLEGLAVMAEARV